MILRKNKLRHGLNWDLRVRHSFLMPSPSKILLNWLFPFCADFLVDALDYSLSKLWDDSSKWGQVAAVTALTSYIFQFHICWIMKCSPKGVFLSDLDILSWPWIRVNKIACFMALKSLHSVHEINRWSWYNLTWILIE